MLNLKKVAVTGGLASGKSTVCLLFEKKGAFRVSSDAIVHSLLSPNTSVGREVIDLLGPQIVVEGKISRGRIASSVFQKPALLKKLESILHPAVREVIRQEYEKAVLLKRPLFIVEVPLLFEAGFEKDFDVTIAVTAPLDIRQKRYKGPDFSDRIEHQMSDEERAQKAHYVIENKGDITLLETQVNHFFSILTRGH